MQQYEVDVTEQDGAFKLGAKAATTASAVLLGKLFTIIVAGLTFILVARLLGPTSYGVYAVATSVISFFLAAGDFGIGTTFTKFVAEYSSVHNDKKIAELLANGYLILIITGMLCSLLVFALSGFFAMYALHSSTYAYVIEVAAFIIIMCVLYYASYAVLVGIGSSRNLSLSVVIQITVQATVSLGLAFSGYGALAPTLGLLLGYAAGAAFTTYIVLKRIDLTNARISIKSMKDILHFAVPLAASGLITSIMSNLTIVMLGIFATASIVGYFGIVQRTSSLVSVLSDSLGVAILPMFAAKLAQHKNMPTKSNAFYTYAVYVAFLFITPIMLYAILLARPFTITVFGGAYAPSSLYVAIMSVGVLIGIAGSYAVSLLTSANKVRLVLKCYAIVAVVQLASLAVLVPYFKGIGAVFQLFIISPIATTLVFIYATKKTLNARLDHNKILRVIFASLISAAFILPLLYLVNNYIPLLVSAAVEQLVLYPPILAITSAATRKDLKIFKQVSGSIPVVNFIMGFLVDYSLRFCPVSRTET